MSMEAKPAPLSRPRRPRIFFPDGIADDGPLVERRGTGGRTVADAANDVPVVPAPPAAQAWRCSLKAALLLRDWLDGFDGAGEDPARIRAAADEAIAAVRDQCTFAGTSPHGSEVWALPRGSRRIGLVFATGAEAPGARTIVLALSPMRMDADYPAGEHPDHATTHLRGLLALRALDMLADEAGPDSDAARQRALVRESTAAELKSLLAGTGVAL